MLQTLTAGTDTPKILVRFPNWIGDVVMALPGLEKLKSSISGGSIWVLAKPWVADVIRMSPSADRVVQFQDPGIHSGWRGRFSLARSLKKEGFAGAVLFQNAFEAALVTRAAGIPLRGGYDTDMRGMILTHPVPRPRRKGGHGHQINYYVDLAAQLGFSAEADMIPHLEPGPCREALEGLVVMAPGASFGPAKMWPVERYSDLGRKLAAMGHDIAVVGSSAESTVCGQVVQGIGSGARDLSGKTTLKEVACIMSRSTLVVCNDSGLMHLAAAVGARLVALFGSTDPDATGPVSESAQVLTGSAHCAPCFLRECPTDLECFQDLGVDTVLEACVKTLEDSA